MAGIRETARAEHMAAILRLARVQVEQHGAADLSLRAIAREMGMVSSAVYRYVASRDELLTMLIIESYEHLGDALERADARIRRNDFRGRFRAEAAALRAWAIDHPSEWALLFGTPVPGYAAPQDTIGPASRYTAVLMRLLVDMEAAGHTSTGHVPAPLRRDYARLRASFPMPRSDALLQCGMSSWAAMMGAISLELFGHLHNVIATPGALYDAIVEQCGDQLLAGLPGTAQRWRPSKAV